MNKQAAMHEGLYEVLRRIGDYVKEGHVLPRYVRFSVACAVLIVFPATKYLSCFYSNLPSENRAAGLGGTGGRAGGNGGGGGNRSGGGGNNGSGNGRGAESANTQSYLYPYGAQDQEIIVDIAGTDQAEDEYLMDRKRKAVSKGHRRWNL